MLQTDLDVQTRSAQLEELHELVAFYEKQICKSLEELDHRGREDMWSERIRTAQFGTCGKE